MTSPSTRPQPETPSPMTLARWQDAISKKQITGEDGYVLVRLYQRLVVNGPDSKFAELLQEMCNG